MSDFCELHVDVIVRESGIVLVNRHIHGHIGQSGCNTINTV